MTVLDGLAKAKLQAFREFSDFILGHTSHDDQTKFAVAVQCVDIVILEQHPHVVIQQFLRILNAVQCIAGKTGYFLCDDNHLPFAGFPTAH